MQKIPIVQICIPSPGVEYFQDLNFRLHIEFSAKNLWPIEETDGERCRDRLGNYKPTSKQML